MSARAAEDERDPQQHQQHQHHQHQIEFPSHHHAGAKTSDKFWQKCSQRCILTSAMVTALLVYMFFMARNIHQLHQSVDHLQGRLAENQRHVAIPTTKDIEIERVLMKTELKIQSCFKKVMDLRGDFSSQQKTEVNRVPKILWLYTEHKFQGERMLEQFLGRNLQKIGKQAGLQVRTTNSWQAYDWLSAKTTQKITQTMQNMRVDQKVNQLLKVALLMEHGGIMVSASEVLLSGGLEWVFSYFNRTTPTDVLLFSEYSFDSGQSYQAYFMAAVPMADLVVEIFNTLCDTITLTSIKYPQLQRAAYLDTGMNVTVVHDILKNTINGVLNLLKPEIFSVATIQIDVSQRSAQACLDKFYLLMRQSPASFAEVCGKNDYFLRFTNRQALEDQIELALDSKDYSAKNLTPDTYWHQLLDLGSNLKYFVPSPPREVRYCMLDVKPSQNLTLIKQSLAKLKKQSYEKWVAVYFVERVTEEMSDFAAQQNSAALKILLLNSSSNIGRNYELGIIKHCPQKSFIFLLKREQSFQSQQALQKLAETLEKPGTLGAYISMNVSGKLHEPQNTFPQYTKVEMNGRKPKYPKLNEILNFLKVFHSDCYKILPQFSLYTHEGEYYSDRFKFLQAFVQMVLNLTQKHDQPQIPHSQRTKWLVKSSYELFDVPNRIDLVKEVVVGTGEWEEVNRTQIAMNNFKHDVYPMSYSLDHLLQNGQSMADFAIYNAADEVQPYTRRNKPDIIPKIFHLIWVEGEMPEAKRKVIEMNRELYPDFEVKVWSKANITRDNFPLSYELLLNIYKCNKFTRYSKMASMADVMRHEILYYEGGVYMDTSMVLFNNAIYKWLSYKAFLSTEHIFRHRWMQNMCIFAAMPKYPGLLRIIQNRNTNRYNIFLRDAMEIAGPSDFRHFIKGYEEYDKDILILDFDGFYPMTYEKSNYYEPYCLTQPWNLKQVEEVVFWYNGMALIKNCGKYYPYSFGKELNGLGSSWQNPRW